MIDFFLDATEEDMTIECNRFYRNLFTLTKISASCRHNITLVLYICLRNEDSTRIYCQALVPTPVVLDPIPNQSKIKIQWGLDWGDTKITSTRFEWE